MRRFHRWFGLTVAIFMILISVTGVILQVQVIAEDHVGPPPVLVAAQAQSQPAGQTEPLATSPAQQSGGDLHGLIMHIHSGEYFGKFANVIGLVCGLALFFFSVSGLWMYWQMFSARVKNGRGEVFWK